MSHFPQHTPESAPEAARDKLQAGKKRFGFVPNLYAHLAEAPPALDAYFDLSNQFDKTSFSLIERQVVMLAASAENGCEFCVAAHSMMARKMAKAPDAVVDALRARGTLPDPKLQALAAFTRTMVQERGWVVGAPLEAFLAAGYTPRQALEVVLGVTMKTLSNYANHLTGTTTNPEFASEAWTRLK
ncbi:alkylhydroperoxidase [Pseudomonas fluorescens]|uniref:Alkylhydroperoxidase n=1 Tax=Pseudomonas fluorescens TaxID=294 RepID=A0A379I930_PSEFL|nr:carboxymuconolactone decarboxylase family protein [Pseudomonas fluorescens]AIG05026.1 carboxymuconolactone decarboxylase [Pseudomonas fluorescens]SUD29370.1 alkylhydroperoxidase [Pseudomonas fluorescens]